MKIRAIILFVLFLLPVSVIKAQCSPPPPTVKSVSVVPNTNGGVLIKWDENTADTCITTGYDIYRYNYQGQQTEWIKLVNANIRQYTDSLAKANERPQIYRMTTKAGPSGNEHSENHHTILLNPVVSYGPCALEAHVSWTPYKISYRDHFEERPNDKKFNDAVEYEIWGYETSASSVFNVLQTRCLSARFSSSQGSFAIKANINYQFYIKSYLPNGEVSYSNVRNAITDGAFIPVVPEYITIDSLVSHDLGNRLYFRIDTATTVKIFKIERAETKDGQYQSIYEFDNKNTLSFDDTDCDINSNNFYRISAYTENKNCAATPLFTSDTINSIILSLKYIGYNAELRWNELCTSASYDIFKQQQLQINQKVTNYTDTGIKSDLLDKINKFCYFVVAKSEGGASKSISRTKCFTVNEVNMPNAIVIGDIRHNLLTNRKSNEFAPVIAGDEEDYEYSMLVFNRWNNVVFETIKPMGERIDPTKHCWLGPNTGGKEKFEDVYIYYIKVIFKDSNKKIEKKGTISVIFNR